LQNVGAHQDFNDSRDLIDDPFSGMIVVRWLGLATVNLSTKFEVFISTHYEDTKWI